MVDGPTASSGEIVIPQTGSRPWRVQQHFDHALA